jgi:hypothetical protein
MNVPRYATERVEYWENSALDSRIYLVEPGYSTLPQNPDEQLVNAVENESDASSDHGTQIT